MANSSPMADSEAESALPALLALDDTEFVQQAYRLLLGRDSDEVGLGHYVQRLRDGEDKRRLIADLASSDEGRQRSQRLAGLADLVRAHAERPQPWPERAARALLRRLGAPGREPVERALRRADNRLYRMERLILRQSSEISALRHDVAQLSVTLEALRAGQAQGASTDGPSAPATRPAPPPRQAPVRVEQLFRQMRRAALRHSTGER
jgi:hypothetical protein